MLLSLISFFCLSFWNYFIKNLLAGCFLFFLVSITTSATGGDHIWICACDAVFDPRSILPSSVLPSFYWYRCALDLKLGEEYLSLVWDHQYLLLIYCQYAAAPHHIPCQRKGLSAHCYNILGHFVPRPYKLVVESQVLADAPSTKRTMTTLRMTEVYRTAH